MVTVAKGIKGALRVGQTLSVLGRTGFDWLRGDRPPAPRLLRQTFERLGATYIKPVSYTHLTLPTIYSV